MKVEADSRKQEAINNGELRNHSRGSRRWSCDRHAQPAHKKNAMSPKLRYEMVELLSALRYDKDLRVLVITGKGDSFSAGET